MEEELDEPINFTPHDDINACYSALNSLADIDTYLLNEEEKEMISEIKRMSLYILYTGLREIFISNFYETSPQDSSSEAR